MKPLLINMLGEFSISYDGKTINDSSSRSKKLWSVLEYLVAFRGRSISQGDLIELLWPDDEISNPANTLKTLLYRVRTLVEALGFGNGKEIIIYSRGTYLLNGDLDLVVDTEVFEDKLKQAALAASSDDCLALLMAAIDIYKGDFLPQSAFETWVIPLSTYYHSKYVQAVEKAIELLAAQNRHSDIITLCRKALAIDPYDENLHYWQMLSLFRAGEQQQALKHYDFVTEMFFSYYGIKPSERLVSLYKEIIAVTNSAQADLGTIKVSLAAAEADNGAFYCEYPIFKDIYLLNMRSAARSGDSIHLCLLTLTDKQGDGLPQKQINRVLPRVRECVQQSLRRGDVFTRYSPAQLLILLPSTSYENAVMVMQRIYRAFTSGNGKGKVSLKYSVQPLTPESKLF